MKKELIVLFVFVFLVGCNVDEPASAPIAEVEEPVEIEEMVEQPAAEPEVEIVQEVEEPLPEPQDEEPEVVEKPLLDRNDVDLPPGLAAEFDTLPPEEQQRILREFSEDDDEDSPGYGERFGVDSYDLSQGIPKFVNHNFVELDKIDRISKFRSGYGHDYSHDDEECRSMKHYFSGKGDPHETHSPRWRSIKYYAPVSGTIQRVRYSQNDYGQEAQFSIASSEKPGFNFGFFHVALEDGLEEGSTVEAGQYIGTVGDEMAHAEIAVDVISQTGLHVVSFFDVASDAVFDEYKARGVPSREEFIISQEHRDANPLKCDPNTEEGRFIPDGESTSTFQKWQASGDNWVFLS